MNRDSRYLLEVCVDNVDDAVAAEGAGADRIEFCRDLGCGGLTPDLNDVKALLRLLNIPVVVLVRSRPGDFVYSNSEKAVMLDQVRQLVALPIAGIAVGGLTSFAEIDTEFMSDVAALALHKTIVMHRAFDLVPDPSRSAKKLIDLGISRVLTAGGNCPAEMAVSVLNDLNRMFHGSLEILVGGAVRSTNARRLLDATGAFQIHSSARSPSKQDGGASRFSSDEVERMAAVVAQLNN